MHLHPAQTASITSTFTPGRSAGAWLQITNSTNTNCHSTKWSLRRNTHPRTRRSINSPVTFFPATMRASYISRSQLAVEQHMSLTTIAMAAVTVAQISSPGPSSTLQRTARWTRSLRCASQRTERRPKSRGPRRRPRRISSSTPTTGSSRRITN